MIKNISDWSDDYLWEMKRSVIAEGDRRTDAKIKKWSDLEYQRNVDNFLKLMDGVQFYEVITENRSVICAHTEKEALNRAPKPNVYEKLDTLTQTINPLPNPRKEILIPRLPWAASPYMAPLFKFQSPSVAQVMDRLEEWQSGVVP